MNKKLLYFTGALVYILVFSGPLFSEYIFLKNGSIHKGRIVKDTADSITIRTENKKYKTFPRARIMRILYTDLYMGKVYVRLTDGTVVEAYQVDEEQKYLIFRKKLYSPKEFKLKRSRILFKARKNPNELEGKADFYSVTLRWKPPVGTVKAYRVYLRKKDEQYPEKPVKETSGLTVSVDDLKSSTDYCFIVTAVDNKGSESLPSNEVSLQTKNRPPEAPENLSPDGPFRVNRRVKNRGYVTLKWSASEDVDGTVKKYILFRKEKEKRIVLASTDKTRYVVRKLPLKKNMTFYVAAVDNRNLESSSAAKLSLYTFNRPPQPPSRVICRSIENDKTQEVRLSWSGAADPDGGTLKYALYEKQGNIYREIARTDRKEYLLPGKDKSRVYSYRVRTIDNGGLMSGESQTVRSTDSFFNYFLVRLTPVFVIPLGNFGRLHDYGAGFKAGVYTDNLLGDSFLFGLEFGYIYYGQKSPFLEKSWALLGLFQLEYRFNFFSRFVPFVAVSPGVSYNYARYDPGADGTIAESSFEPYFHAEAGLRFLVTDSFAAGLSGGYGFIYESAGIQSFATVGLRCHYHF